jgi:two-component system, LytTR family, sensor kinase
MARQNLGTDRRWVRSLAVVGLQLLGWAVYGLIYYYTLRPYNPFVDVVQQQALWAAATGLAFSSALGLGYAQLGVARWHPGREALAVVGGSAGVGWIWGLVNHWGAEWIDPFVAPVIAYVALFPGQGSMLSYPAAFPALLLIWSGFYLGLTYWSERQTQQERVLQADAEAQRARLQMLRYQLNPHFFFNALNTISALADESPRRVKKAVRELSGFLRYSLLPDEAQTVTLREELAAIEHYLAVEQMRFEDDLEVTVDIDAAAAARPVPAFLVLPLVENAIKHGQRTSPFPLRVAITGTVTDGALVISVANTGCLREDAAPDASGTGTGLANVRARLHAQYPGAHAFALEEDDGWVRARIDIEQSALNPSLDHD